MTLATVLASTQQSVGGKLEMSLDGGALAEIALYDGTNSKGVAADLEIEESMDNIGGDRLSLSLIGASYSPFTSNALRGKRGVALTGYHAKPGEVLTYANTFTGYLFGNEFSAFPPVSKLTILDSAQAYNTPLVYELAPGHGLTRAQVVTAICALSPAIPTGTITLGARGAVALSKPVSEGGTRGRLEFLAEYLAPCGVRIWFSGGNLQIAPYDSGAASVRTITADLVCPDGASVQVPDLSRATKVTVTSTSLTVTAPGSTRTETETETITALYQPGYAIKRRYLPGGSPPPVEEDYDASVYYPTECAESVREVYKKITARTYDGATLVSQTVTEYEYKARKATPRTYRYDSNGDPITDGEWSAPGYTVYQYADGEWYADLYQTPQIVQKSVLTRNFDGDDYLLSEVEERNFFQFIRSFLFNTTDQIGQYTTTPGYPSYIYVTDSDEGVTDYRESIGLVTDGNRVDERTTTTYNRATSGQLLRVVKTVEAFGIGPRRGVTTGWSPVYGLTNRTTAGVTAAYLGGLTTTTTETYKQINQNRYVYTSRLNVTGAAPAGAGDYVEPLTTEDRIGSVPYCEKKESQEVAAEVTASVTDSVRIAINGTVELVQDNQWCESVDDCTSLAESLRRDESAVPVTVEVPFCWDLHKNDWITLNVPVLGISNVKMYIYGLTRSLSNYRTRLSLLWYPAEVA